jgi:hypothetical protein
VLLPLFATTKSRLPSPLKSPIATETAPEPVASSAGIVNATEEVGLVVSKKARLEVPPPGAGLKTDTKAVLRLAMSTARSVAVSFESLTTVVARALPFHFTTEPGTNPVPLTVSLGTDSPGTASAGLSGWLMKGTGFAAAEALALIVFEVPVIDAVTVSVAVIVCPPTDFSAAGKVPVPFTSVESAGKSACPPVLLKCTIPE